MNVATEAVCRRVVAGQTFLRHLRAALIVCSIVACAAVAQDAVTHSETVLTVEVSNGTTNGAAVVDDPVTVRIYERDQLIRTLEGKVGGEGKAIFENMPAGQHVVAVAGVKHQDIVFISSRVPLSPTQKQAVVGVRVFDVSHDKSKLSVGTHHVIIKAAPMGLEIAEYMLLRNTSDMAISSKNKDSEGRTIVLDIVLPKGFKNLKPSSYFENENLVVTEDGFYDVLAVPPGEHEAAFSYVMEPTSDSLEIRKNVSLATSDFVVFAELGKAELVGLGAGEPLRQPNGGSVRYYRLGPLARGAEVAFQIKGFHAGASSYVTAAVMAAAILGAIAIVSLSRLHRRASCSVGFHRRRSRALIAVRGMNC